MTPRKKKGCNRAFAYTVSSLDPVIPVFIPNKIIFVENVRVPQTWTANVAKQFVAYNM